MKKEKIQTNVVGVTVAFESDDGDTHEETLAGGGSAGVGPGVETDVHATVGGEVVDVLGDEEEEIDP